MRVSSISDYVGVYGVAIAAMPVTKVAAALSAKLLVCMAWASDVFRLGTAAAAAGPQAAALIDLSCYRAGLCAVPCDIRRDNLLPFTDCISNNVYITVENPR